MMSGHCIGKDVRWGTGLAKGDRKDRINSGDILARWARRRRGLSVY